MVSNQKIWDPKEWEKYALDLVGYHYGIDNVIKVPDEHKGDYGIEAFTTTGIVYQMYAAKEPIDVKSLYEKQRTKIYTDINKFINNKNDLIALFGNIKIRRWVLFVPCNKSSELVKYAAIKTAEVVSQNLPYVDIGFQILIKDESDFHPEKQLLIKSGALLLDIEMDDVGNDVINKFEVDKPVEISNIEKKILSNYEIDDSKFKRIKEKLIREYILGNNVYDKLYKDYPEIWNEIIAVKQQREQSLLIESLDNPQTIPGELEKLKKGMKNLNKVHDNSIEHLSYEAISDWLMRCPLDFKK